MNARILVVDDEEAIRTMVAVYLAGEGYRCRVAANAEEAQFLLQMEPADLVLLDITMPGESGVQVLMEIKEHSPQTAVVMVSANYNLETARFCIRQGAEGYLVKPFALDRLHGMVRRVLARRRPGTLPEELPGIDRGRGPGSSGETPPPGEPS